MTIQAALVQLNSGDDPLANLPVTLDLVSQAAEQGADFVATPEVTNIVSSSRSIQDEVLKTEQEDPTLEALKSLAEEKSIWLLIGSLALKSDDPKGRFVNRSFLVSPRGQIAARYDKIHMFDVEVSESESYRESAGYRPGENAVIARLGFADIGMTVCYDVRFPALYRKLSQAGASIITVPSAFSQVTGASHWHTLLRARAIENGCYVLAPAQTGVHASTRGKKRATFGHSLAVDPWGRVLCDAGTEPGIALVEIEISRVKESRNRVPSLVHDRKYRMKPNANRYK